jgi:sensor domain CHASE-containing protein
MAMSVRRQMLLVYGGAMLLLVALLYFFASTIVLRSFVTLEQQRLRADLDRVRAALDDSVGEVQRIASDWAVWDETYAFAGGENTAYVDSNLVPSSIANLRVNLLAVVAADGRLVASRGFDLERGAWDGVPDGTEGLVARDGPLFQRGSAGPVGGLVQLGGRTLLVGAHPIFASTGEGPSRGVLVMGRYLDGAEVERLAHRTRLAFTVFRTSDPRLPADVGSVLPSLSPASPTALRAANNWTISGYQLATDLAGAPSLVLRVERPRDIYQLGKTDVLYMVGTFLATGVFFAVFGMIVLGAVLSRVAPRMGAGFVTVEVGRTPKTPSDRPPARPTNGSGVPEQPPQPPQT